MKFSLPRSVLAEAVRWVSRAVPTSPVMPVLGGVRLQAADGTLVLSAFDYDLSARVTVPADTGEDGAVLVPGRLLAGLTATLTAETATVASNEAAATLACGAGRFTLPLLPIRDFPELPELPTPAGTLLARDLTEATGQVSPAVDVGSRRSPALSSIRMEIAPEGITLVATDSYRCAVRELEWQPSACEEGGFQVPDRVLAELARAFPADTQLRLGVSDHLLSLAGDGREVTTRLLADPFPSWRTWFKQTLPQVELTASVATGMLTEAVTRADLVSGEQLVHLRLADDGLTVTAGSPSDGEGIETLPLHRLTGTPHEIAVNTRYLLDALRASTAPLTALRVGEPNRPLVVHPDDGDEGDDGVLPPFRALLMPRRT